MMPGSHNFPCKRIREKENKQKSIFVKRALRSFNLNQMIKSQYLYIPVCCLILAFSLSCKTVARTAARYWTKRQINSFVHQCESKTGQLIGAENARKYCDCAVDVVAEKYREYKQTETLQLTDLLAIINGCR